MESQRPKKLDRSILKQCLEMKGLRSNGMIVFLPTIILIPPSRCHSEKSRKPHFASNMSDGNFEADEIDKVFQLFDRSPPVNQKGWELTNYCTVRYS